MADLAEVSAALIGFFERLTQYRSPIDIESDVRHSSNYDSNILGWRALANKINHLPALIKNSVRIDPSAMDAVRSIRQLLVQLRIYRSPGALPVLYTERSLRVASKLRPLATPRQAAKVYAALPLEGRRARVMSARRLAAELKRRSR